MENIMKHSPETEPAAATVKNEVATFIFRCVGVGIREQRGNTGDDRGSPTAQASDVIQNVHEA